MKALTSQNTVNLFSNRSNTMIKFNSHKPWAVALASSLLVTYGSFTFVAGTFQHAASEQTRVASAPLVLPPVTVVGTRAAVADEFAGQSVQTGQTVTVQAKL